MDGMKKCNKCGPKPIANFDQYPDGSYYSTCRRCLTRKRDRDKRALPLVSPASPKPKQVASPNGSWTQPQTLEGRIEQAYQRISDLTRTLCGEPCGRPGFCCKPEFCEMTIRHARENFDVHLARTKHPSLPLMGQYGCTVAPHLRPICTIYVCEKHLAEDSDFAFKYQWLRDNIDKLELEKASKDAQQCAS